MISDYHYELPEALIAKYPAPQRDGSRMLILCRKSQSFYHAHFTDFPSLLQTGDLVVLNNSRVIPARVFSADAKVELLVLEQLPGLRWKCFVQPGRRMRVGAAIPIGTSTARVIEILPAGERILELSGPIDLHSVGTPPLPPYMKRPAEHGDTSRYQTVYAQHPGSIAAPTAGLHFTEELLPRIPHAFLTLHVGAGTFLPVKTERIEEHLMHEEHFQIPPETASKISEAQRIVAVGTTVTRVLESQPPGPVQATSGSTRLFIRPPYSFQRVQVLLTNFHLPRSTLLMLVCAFAGKDFVMAAYQEAIDKQYRFFSYGDCMLVL